jgi:hypothetical protein
VDGVAILDEQNAGAAIRVALADLPAALQDSLVQEVSRQTDMRVVGSKVGTVTERVDLLLAVTQGVDVLVLGTPDAASPPGICDHLLTECPDLVILLVSHTGEAATMHWLGPRRYKLRRVSAEGMVRVTRHAVSARTSPHVKGVEAEWQSQKQSSSRRF